MFKCMLLRCNNQLTSFEGALLGLLEGDCLGFDEGCKRDDNYEEE